MALVLKQVRECDGACCSESPRFPNADHSDCIFRDASKPNKGCALMDDASLIPEGMSSILPNLTANDAFEQTCLFWPENSDPKTGETANCCWKWIEP